MMIIRNNGSYIAVYVADEGNWRMVAYHSVHEPEPQSEQQ